MTAAELLAHLQRLDIRVWAEGDRLRLSSPKGAISPELRGELLERKAELIALLESAAGDPGNVSARGQADGGGARSYVAPLSSAQERMWFIEQLHSNAANQLSMGIQLDGELHTGALRRALDALVQRHESLRTTFCMQDGRPVQAIAATGTAAFDLRGGCSPADVDSVLADEAARPFDLERGPLLRALLLVLGPERHILLLTLHHIICDGWSLGVLLRELSVLYDAAVHHSEPDLPPLSTHYADYARWQRDQLAGEALANQLAYWRRQLRGTLPVLELPTDHPRPSVEGHGGERITFALSTVALHEVHALARREQATLFMVLLAAFTALLTRYSGEPDTIVGTPTAGRGRPEWEGLVGLFVNTLVLRTDAGGDPTFLELLARVRETAIEAYTNQDVPLERLVEDLRPTRDPSRNPLFQVMFDLQNMTPPPAFAGLALRPVAVDRRAAQLDLTLSMMTYEGRLHAQWEYSTSLFDRATIERLARHYERLLLAAVTDPTQRLSRLSMLTAEDEAQLLGTCNNTAVEHDWTRCVHTLLEERAKAEPGATAVVDGDTTLSYGELDCRANRLAHLLVRHGVTPGARVAVCLDRTADIPAVLAAVLKAGAAYVPLDPAHPAERLRYTIEDAGVACILTLGRFAPRFGRARAPLVRLDEVEAEIAAQPSGPVGVETAPGSLAYVIYTSGSTGRPKGVEVEHRNVVAFLDAMRREPGMTPRDALLAVTTLSFDIAGLEFWLPLTTGARVVVASRADVLDGERLVALVERHGITVMQATPATWRLMLETGWGGKRDLRVLCGGEALPRDLAAALVECVGELWNMYGPTETTIWSTASRIDDAQEPITIGRPIANTRVYVFEPSGLLAPVGVPGELCIAGEGVARGYHDLPQLTAEKFANVTLPDGRVERVYRTGDVARIRADGRLDFLGRRDQQVKVRGHRIELGEIEAALAACPGVKECVAAVREDDPGDRRIVAYVVQREGTAFDEHEARAALRVALPEYMVPQLFAVLPALPLTANGKVDRKALPFPQTPARPAGDASQVTMTPTQHRVAAVWREVLREERVGLHDNFFDVGGHSLLLVQLHTALQREFGGTLQLVELFQWTTVAAQATRVSAPTATDGALRRAQLRAARQR